MGLKSALVSLFLVLPLGWTHPGHEEKIYQHAATPKEARSLDQCQKAFSEPEFVKRTVERHGEEFLRLRRNLGVEDEKSPHIHKRNYITVSKIDHHSNKTVSKTTDPVSLFSDAGACMLMPAVDQGPLYVLGEQIRQDITEGEAGIPLTLAIQVVDYKTCKVVPDAYVDIWSSNATGVYVGVQGYPGMGDPKDSSILKGTALRGVWHTDDHGLAVFHSVLPGHYSGRATHIHAIVYMGATKQPNNTITGGHAAHVGQLYFDQPLLANVDKVIPYNKNTMTVQPNVQDFLFMMGANGDDPIVRYAMVGDKLEDGMFAWIRFGIDATANKPVSPAAWMTKDGGVMNPKGPVAQINGWSGGMSGGRGKGNKKRAL